jgi:DNA-binding NarL/FixJ family response regulator
LGNVHFYDLNGAVAHFVYLLYRHQPLPPTPKSNTKKTKRNAEIQALHAQGMSIPELARKFGVSEQRIHQILRGRRK